MFIIQFLSCLFYLQIFSTKAIQIILSSCKLLTVKSFYFVNILKYVKLGLY